MKKNLGLLGLLLLLACSLLLVSFTQATVEKELAPMMREASRRTAEAFAHVRGQRIASGILIELAEDVNDTGLIGILYSGITTTLGSLETKRSTTNPNIAAMVVELFGELGLEKGDRVAINLSSSFPALNIAVLCAAETLGLEYNAAFSIGASTYGATLPALTYGDMETALRAEGLLQKGSYGFSPGGWKDQGLDMSADALQEIAARLQGYGYRFLETADMDENIARRVANYEREGPVRCLVNVGGNEVAFGFGSGMESARGGILRELPIGESGNGLVQHYLRRGIPVMHLLNMKDLLSAYGLPYDPIPLPAAGEGEIYHARQSNPWLLRGLVALNLLAIGIYGYRFGIRQGRAGKPGKKRCRQA